MVPCRHAMRGCMCSGSGRAAEQSADHYGKFTCGAFFSIPIVTTLFHRHSSAGRQGRNKRLSIPLLISPAPPTKTNPCRCLYGILHHHRSLDLFTHTPDKTLKSALERHNLRLSLDKAAQKVRPEESVYRPFSAGTRGIRDRKEGQLAQRSVGKLSIVVFAIVNTHTRARHLATTVNGDRVSDRQ